MDCTRLQVVSRSTKLYSDVGVGELDFVVRKVSGATLVNWHLPQGDLPTVGRSRPSVVGLEGTWKVPAATNCSLSKLLQITLILSLLTALS
jgi:hypothetical protein